MEIILLDSLQICLISPLKQAHSGMDSPTDEIMLQQIAVGDENALALLYDRYGRSAYSLAYRILGDAHSAEDVVQEAFLNVWRMAGSFSHRRGEARSWLLSVVHHRAIDAWRRRRSRPTTTPVLEYNEPVAETEAVWQQVANSIDYETIKRAMNKLPNEQREVIAMAYFDGYTHREIAEVTKIPLGTVKGRIRRGMDKLRNLLDNQEAVG